MTSRVEFLVNEAFGPTLQGEGPSIGRPCVFLRLAVCNLNCSWCDTPYTWSFTDRKAALHDTGVKYEKAEEVHNMIVHDVIDLLLGLLADLPTTDVFERKLVVISGGEPMLQQDAIATLVNKMGPMIDFEIETAGTIAPKSALLGYPQVKFNVSPKLSHSGNDAQKSYKPEVLEMYARNRRANFKFVASDESDLREIDENYVIPYAIPSSRIYIMPLGTVPEEIIENMRVLADPVIDLGWNLTTRMHTLIWGMERGR